MKSIEFVSAQNVKIEYEFATPFQRAVASLIDIAMLILYVIVVIISLSAAQMGKDFLIYELILLKIPWIFYHPILEYLTQGQTLGKYVMGIRVVTNFGERPGLREIFTRWIFKGYFLWIAFSFAFSLQWIADIAVYGSIHIAMGVIGFLYASIGKNNQRMGDVMAGTIVIRNRSNVRYSLKDVLSIKNQNNYSPQYPGVVRFTDEDMLLIKNTIQRVQSYPNPETKKFAIELADKSAELIGLPKTPEKRLKFLQTLLQDYVVLTR